MNTKTKTSKRIFSLFLAVICTLGVFFVSHIDSFASDYRTIIFDRQIEANASYVSSLVLSIDGVTYSGFVVNPNNNRHASISVSLDITRRHTIDYIKFSYNGNTYYANSCYYPGSFSDLSGTMLSVDSSVYTPLDFISDGIFIFRGFTNNLYRFYFGFNDLVTPSPTPAPATPTPTPDPGGSIPTPSGDYGSFFQRMASDAQSAFNALYLSWTNANNRFYSSIFFIGLPLLITVFGIVAGIILGDDD